MEKEQYVEIVKELRGMIKSGKYDACPCPKVKCEWHGRCRECVMIHRVHQDHVPNCLQPILENKIREIAKTCELIVTPKEKTPDEYWDYVNRVCPNEEDSKGGQ